MPRFCPLPRKGEQWLPCPDFPSYEVSNGGRIRRDDRVLTLSLSKGYPSVLLSEEGKQSTRIVSRLMARAFLGEPDTPDLEAAHKDGNRENNYIENIRWSTKRRNTDDRYTHGTVFFGEDHPKSHFTNKEVEEILQNYQDHMAKRKSLGFSRAERGYRQALVDNYGVPEHVIKDILVGRSWVLLQTKPNRT